MSLILSFFCRQQGTGFSFTEGHFIYAGIPGCVYMLHGNSPGTAWCPTVGSAVSGAGKVTVTTDR